MEAAILDTDSLSEVLKRKNQQVLLHARRYLAAHRRLAFSAMTLYEVVRGLKAIGSARQMSDFTEVVSSSEVIPIDVPVLIRAGLESVRHFPSVTAVEHGRMGGRHRECACDI